ncbi:MAG TPA: hypothetical protein VL334_00845, partial [Anaerolineae bacterium]|nr:hypothetical protein [Anaerolineae bacterium]
MTKGEQRKCGQWAAAGLCALLVGLAGCGGALTSGDRPTSASVTVTVRATQISSPTIAVGLPSATPA